MADIEATTARFAGSDGTSLFYRRCVPEKEKFLMVISHGLGEHSGRYGHVADTFGPLGASLWMHDHRGHGRSRGQRGHVNNFDEYVQDLKQFIEMVRMHRKDHLPLLLMGHSMGGLIALSFARRHPRQVDGLIVSSPLLGVPKPPPAALITLVRIMSRLWPTLSLDNQLDPAFISHDDAEVEAYRNSDLVHRKISARWFVSCMSEIEKTGGSADAIRTPILMQIAGQDRLVSAPAAMAYFDALTVADKTVFHYENLYHEIYNEKLPEREKVLQDVKQWVVDRFLSSQE